MSRREAILTGVGEAAALQERLGIRDALASGDGPVDVFGVIEQLHLPLLFRPLEGMLGLYLPPPAGPGIMVTTRRPLHLQRFTAAHELGHFVLKHASSSFDKRIGFVARGEIGQDVIQEVAADAFAAEFMLPRWLLVSHAKRRGWGPQDLRKPETVYQLSLRLGMSYEATCHSLAGHNMLQASETNALLSVAPKACKQHVLRNISPESWHLDVWDLSVADGGSRIVGGPQDVVVITLEEHVASGYTWDLSAAERNGFSILQDDRLNRQNAGLGAIVDRRVVMSGPANGFLEFLEKRGWSDDPPLNSIRFDLSLHGKESLPLVDELLVA
jgi:Zn-dependent peptidase ImmA (M78 family)